jgi:hypothetical protein
MMDMHALHIVCVTGVLERHPAMRFEDDSQQVTAFTVCMDEPGKDGAMLYVPVARYGT